ncbi:VWA domain-containing protein [Leucobacter allii]|uniref:vWA domain-containing protein n=1 Tax=Leucobacter allii TaxID=2932247 RepID=UPI001FD215A2|nr:vWA domain-containing protein [Leucobacter allii]UOR03479.1 VWA domain-containing protein [Leucobacter allii]
MEASREQAGAADAADALGGEAALRAVGGLLGVPVHVVEDAVWRIDDDGLTVGLGWYTARGHAPAEATALAMLALWENVREERIAPERRRRAASLVSRDPAAGPLVRAVLRLQASAALLAAFPALRRPLAAAAERALPADVSAEPRHLQWIIALLRAGSGARAPQRPDASVAEELRALGAIAPGVDVLRRVLAPDPGRAPLARLERALAVLLPPYARLLAADTAEHRAVPGAGGGPAEGADADPDPAPDGNGGGASADAETGAGAAEAPAPASESAGDPEAEPARPGEGRASAEGADLFAAEAAGSVQRFLETPLPAAVAASLVAPPDARTETDPGRRETPASPAAGAGDGGARGGAAGEYRRRAAELAEAIERMRRVWERVISERTGAVHALGRRPAAEGELLGLEHLVPAVVEARAGAPRPAAYLRREHRRRRRERPGSTDYALLVDRSASMRGAAARAAADAALVMLEALAGVARDVAAAEDRTGLDLDLDIRTALIVFDAAPVIVKPLSAGLDDAARRRMFAEIGDARGSTDDGAALATAAAVLGVGAGERGPGPGAGSAGRTRRRVLLLVGDGGTSDPGAAAREAAGLRAAGVELHAIGIGSDDLAVRYAPDGVRLDDPRGIAAVLEARIADGLP